MSIDRLKPQYLVDKFDKSDELDIILEKKLENVKSIYCKKEIYVRINQNNDYNNKIIQIAKTYFDKAGLKVNENNGYISFHSYSYDYTSYTSYTSYDKNFHSDVYYANDHFQNEKNEDDVNECIFITRKDDKINGGDLDIYYESPHNTFFKPFDLSKIETFKLNTGSVFVCSGRTLHRFLNCEGYGIYNFINVTLYENKRSGFLCDNDDN